MYGWQPVLPATRCAVSCWKGRRWQPELNMAGEHHECSVASGSSVAEGIRTPTGHIRSGCCARAATGPASAAPPTSVMNSRRFTRSPLGVIYRQKHERDLKQFLQQLLKSRPEFARLREPWNFL